MQDESLIKKYSHELSYWQGKYSQAGNKFGNSHYQRVMLGVSNQQDDEFLRDKVVVDFGCGPRGSLVWTDKPSIKIGVDVLVSAYMENFAPTMLDHGMAYVQSTEKVIPLPPDFADVVFTLNAMDHTDSFTVMSKEVLRILKPGGLFCGSFNLNEPPTPCEPQTLSEDLVHDQILSHLKVHFYRTSPRNTDGGDVYRYIYEEHRRLTPGEIGFLWVSGVKR